VLIQQQMVRLDTRNKRLMDSLKLIAAMRSTVRSTLQDRYNNYRDDHELFRNLTQADGVLWAPRNSRIYLLPTVNYPPKLEKIVSGLLAQINATHPIMPDGSVDNCGFTWAKNGASSCDRLLTKKADLLRSV